MISNLGASFANADGKTRGETERCGLYTPNLLGVVSPGHQFMLSVG